MLMIANARIRCHHQCRANKTSDAANTVLPLPMKLRYHPTNLKALRQLESEDCSLAAPARGESAGAAPTVTVTVPARGRLSEAASSSEAR
jgi:hypothetical protein